MARRPGSDWFLANNGLRVDVNYGTSPGGLWGPDRCVQTLFFRVDVNYGTSLWRESVQHASATRVDVNYGTSLE